MRHNDEPDGLGKGIPTLEGGKFLLVESEVLSFKIRHTAQRIRNPTNH